MDDGNRTHDRRSHNPELYQLSYVHQRKSASKLTRSVSTRGRLFGAPGGTRTPDPRLRRPLLYPPELPGLFVSLGKMVGVEGFEPPTSCSQSRRATRLRYTPLSDIGPETEEAA